jgi:hypothetical protein
MSMKSIFQVFGALAVLAGAATSAKADEPCDPPATTYYEPAPAYNYAPVPVAHPTYRVRYARPAWTYREMERREAWRRAEAYRRWREYQWRAHHGHYRPY